MKVFLGVLAICASTGLATANDGGKAACDAGDFKACYKGAVDQMIVQNYDLSMVLFSRACEGGVGEGCHFVGRYLDYGRGVPRDSAQALSFFEKACFLGAANSCYWAAAMHRDGDTVAVNTSKAELYFAKGCEAKREEKCELKSIEYVLGTETLDAEQIEHIEMMADNSKRECRSLYHPC